MATGYFMLLLCLGLVWGDPSGCMKMNPCKCLMKDGSGVVNLAALGNMDGFLIQDWKVQREVEGKSVEQRVTFSPCHPFSEPMALMNCSHVAICVVSRDPEAKESAPQYTGFGKHDDNEFVYSNESKILSVTYRGFQIPIALNERSGVLFTSAAKRNITLFAEKRSSDRKPTIM